MNAREMHIEVNQSLQKVSANRTRKYLNEEIDWVLNKMVNRFVQSKVTPRKDGSGGFEVHQVNVDAIRPLIVSGKILPAYIDTVDRYVSFLPPDYSYLLSDASIVQSACGQALPEEVQVTIPYIQLRQERTSKADPAFYETMALTLSNKTVSIPQDLPYSHNYEGYQDKADVNFLVPFLLDSFRSNGFDVYWERYDNVYKPFHYLLVAEAIQTMLATLVIDDTDVTQSLYGTLIKRKHANTAASSTSANRLCASNTIQQLNGTPFFKTSERSPISELSGNKLYLYRDSSFTVNKTTITYVRKPQTISLHLGTDCELAEEFHQAICDRATEYIKGRLENQQGTNLAIQDNELRVIL